MNSTRCLCFVVLIIGVSSFLVPMNQKLIKKAVSENKNRISNFKMWQQREDFSIDVSLVSPGRGGTGDNVLFKINAAYVDTRGTRRTWSVIRSSAEFIAFNNVVSTSSDQLRPIFSHSSDPYNIELYLLDLLRNNKVLAMPDLYDFLAAPIDVVEEPVLIGEVVDDASWDGRRIRSAEEDGEDIPEKSSARIAGAVIGGAIGGYAGAMIGAIAVPTLVKRKDAIGSIARNAGRTTEEILHLAKEVDEEYHVTEKVKEGANSAYSAAKEFNREYGITRKAGAVIGRLGSKIRDIANRNRRKY